MVSTAPDGGPARAGAACDAPGRAEKLPVFVLTGPTGAGKSGWAERLAEAAPVEIVSVDSALVYRGMDIGSAKPDRALRRRLPHHLIDICEPTDNYSAGRFVADATAAIEAIHARGKVPLLVGGTMLYLRALLHGLAQLPEASPEVRRQIDERAAREGWSSLHAELARLDPLAAERISCADPQRIQRALEVCYMTGQPISELQRDTVSPLKGYPVRAWALAPADRAVLHRRLEARFHTMLAAGFLDEVRSLRARGDLEARHSSMRAVGYRQLWAHLAGEYDLAEATRRGITATRQLAKRQLTWMRSEQSLNWLDPDISMSQASWNRDLSQELRELGL
ncbi:MAG TPA: tRNA (adenosine(37)-N6)-dimethylallyltransferase MiaA [Steroidobacteraceae bacterium]|nr:tRNA (adenosine(37)-N6)-dimethylallyltransferase MiaA [Steroidobacteraceae bacterium]